jgi:glutathione-regulated potassium-efflux system ancillary protein KefC/glutathione-regulated potassium-efflux system protein KefB
MLHEAVIYFAAAVICVPIVRRLGFGSVLGYLLAGVAIGPFGLHLVGNATDVMHFAELGVVFLLFIIGLELQPARLWVLRRPIFLLGGLQIGLTTVVLAAIGYLFALSTTVAIICGMILALSSTAFVLQMLAERQELTTGHGRAAFAILLLQDLAVIPLLALIPLASSGMSERWDLSTLTSAGLALGVTIGFVGLGRYLLRPVLRLAAGSGATEIFTATALLVVIGAAALMEWAGLSMALGTFLAGVLLADSEYRHALEADIEPFKGLLLGLFFISVGMSLDLGLLTSQPVIIAVLTVLLLAGKGVAIYAAGRFYGLQHSVARSLAFALPQGGEFAFVLFGVAVTAGLIERDLRDLLVVVVTLSMAVTPLLVQFGATLGRSEDEPARPYDAIDEHNPVIIAGFGRLGQIVGRILRSQQIPFTALESSSAQVDVVREFGNKVFYGNAARLDMLRSAGADKARLFVMAVEDAEQSVRIVENLKQNFPTLPILARARNRQHALALMDMGLATPVRDTFFSGLRLAEQVLIKLGVEPNRAEEVVQRFAQHDEALLARQQAMHHDQAKLMQSAREAATELEELFSRDPTG